MSEETIQVEGASLEEALQNAAKELGVERRAVMFKYDREHLASGASTVRIFASRMSAEELAKVAEREDQARATGPAVERERERRPPPRMGDRDRGGDRRGPRRDGPPSRDRGPRDGDRRGPRDPERRGPPDGSRPQVKKDPERDERLREHARQVARQVLEDGQRRSIDDLNSYERHLVHTAVAEIGGLGSQSEGDQLRKTVHVFKKEA